MQRVGQECTLSQHGPQSPPGPACVCRDAHAWAWMNRSAFICGPQRCACPCLGMWSACSSSQTCVHVCRCVCVSISMAWHTCVFGCVPPRTAFVHLYALMCLRHVHLTVNQCAYLPGCAHRGSLEADLCCLGPANPASLPNFKLSLL